MKKKKGMKRVFVLFLALTMSLSFFQITSFADEGSVADDPTKEVVLQPEETEEITPSEQTTTSAGSNDETAAPAFEETTDETGGATGGETPDEPSDDNTSDDSTTDESTGNACQIGETSYDTLDQAVSEASDGATIELLKDCTTAGLNLSKDLTIDGNGNTITFTQHGIALWGKSLTFQNCNVVMNGIGSTPYTAEWNWMAICASKDASLTLERSKMVMNGSGADNAHAIYFCSNNKLNLTDSTLEISNYQQDALEWDGGDGGYNINLTNSTFISDHNRSGFTGTFYATIDNSKVDVINSTGNGSNGSHFIIKNGSVVNFNNNGSHGLSTGILSIDNSTVHAIGNGANGIHAVGNLTVSNGSEIKISGNQCSISSKWTDPGALYVAGDSSTIDDTCKVEITDNKGSGIYVKRGSFVMGTGTIERNTAEKLGKGGGIYNNGTAVLNEGVELYNNHAATAGDDIYNVEGASITFGTVGSQWSLDGAPDCEDRITGWYLDADTARWSAHSKPLHVEEFNTFTDGKAIVEGAIALKAAHGLIPLEPDDPNLPTWSISKSKTATNLDSNFLSQVTLSLPSAEEALTTDVVFVLDKSTSASVEDQILNMLSNLKTEAEAKDAKVNVGVVIFNKQADIACGLTDLATGYDTIEAAIKKTITSGTNLHAGLLAGKAMLDADTETAASRKYLITVSDGITYMFGEEPTAVAWTFKADTVLNWAGPDNWESKYGTNDAPTDWTAWLSTIAGQIQADAGQYNYPYGGTVGASTPVEEQDSHANSIDTALYKSYETYQSAKAAGYHCYATTATQAKGDQYDWGPSFMNYLANGEEVDFTSIEKEILYLLDAGSTITDKIGKTNDYDFDMVNLQDMILKVGETVYNAAAADEENVYTFGEAVNGVYPYVVTYHPETDDNDEYFDWEINVPVSNLERVQLTYTVKLMNPKSEPGTYGEYDFDGSQNKAGLYTNNEAILYPVDSNGDKGLPEKFNKPTVSYTVSEPYVPPTPPVYTTSATVQKVWKLDDGGTAAASVQIELMRNGEHYDTQILSAANGWKYTWTSLPLGYTWMVKEVNAPEGFTTSISSIGNYFTVTNDDVAATPIVPDDPDDPNNPDQPDNPDNPANPDQPTNPGTVTEPEGQGPEQPTNPDQPKTGDESQLALYLFGLLGAAGTMCIMIRRRRTEK